VCLRTKCEGVYLDLKTGGWRRSCNEELHNLILLVTLKEDNVLGRNLTQKDHSEDLGVGRTLLK
jgi:hypothetical protein